MGEGVGGGEYLNLYPPHLNPLPPGERRYFLRNSKICLDANEQEFAHPKDMEILIEGQPLTNPFEPIFIIKMTLRCQWFSLFQPESSPGIIIETFSAFPPQLTGTHHLP